MTAELKAIQRRPDYLFDEGSMAYWLPEIRNGRFSSFTEDDAENGIIENGVAYLEIGWLGLELNVESENKDYGDGYINKIRLNYFAFTKGETSANTTDWTEIGYLDDLGYDVEVDWDADDWKEQLEHDMFRKLSAFAEENGLSFDHPGWIGEKSRHYWSEKMFGPSDQTPAGIQN